MAIQEERFGNEKELDAWVAQNFKQFFGDAVFIPGFRITTRRDKGGVPDGFVLDIFNSSWSIVEAELISHGVWDHIAEQVMRFVVACQNDDTRQLIRDRFFDAIEADGQIEAISKKLGIMPTRLLQKIEGIIEGNAPDLALFIDDINEDLQDMAEAMNTSVRIFRVKKLWINGQVELYSPDGRRTTFETNVDEVQDVRGNQEHAIEALGGGKLLSKSRGSGIYSLNSGKIIAVKFSKFYPKQTVYWYGVTPTARTLWEETHVTHVAFILGDAGVVLVSIATLRNYLKEAYETKNPDGTVRHYHIYISPPPRVFLETNMDSKIFDVRPGFVPF